MSLKEKLNISDNPQFSLRYTDKTFWLLFGLLIMAGIIALFSAGSTLVYGSGSIIGPVGKQIVFVLIGVAFAFCIQFLPSWLIRDISYIGLAILILCLLLMMLPGGHFVKTINGAGRWFRLGPVSFQPSELAKLALVIVVADLLNKRKSPEDEKKYFLITLGISVLTILPIFLGNLSTAVLMAGIVLLLWILAKVNWKYIAITAIVVISLGVVGFLIADFGFVRKGKEVPLVPRASTWVSRIDHSKQEQQNADSKYDLSDPDNYQRALAQVAVARGRGLGVGPGRSKERDFLPLAYADYIFAIIVEESGFWGAIGLMALYLFILYRACYASSRFGDRRAMLTMMGIALMIVCQAFVSMAVAVGLGPVTGQPLPMITTGGSSTIATSLYFGVMMAISREQNQIKGEQDRVKEESMNDVPTIHLDDIDKL